MYPFARFSGLFLVMPLLGTRMVPAPIRIVLAFAITLVIVPILPPFPHQEALSLNSFFIVLQQLLIGMALGFVIELVTQVFVLAGQLMAMQTGLGIATTVDPSHGSSVVIISQWLLFMVSLVFLSLNGHLVMIEILVDSFRTLPVGFEGFSAQQFGLIVTWSSWMFAAAVIIAIPIMTALLIVNLSFGVMARAAPQLNVFALGFPVTMIVGLFVLSLSMGDIAQSFQGYMEELFEFIKHLTELN